jgi:hypothetical protein
VFIPGFRRSRILGQVINSSLGVECARCYNDGGNLGGRGNAQAVTRRWTFQAPRAFHWRKGGDKRNREPDRERHIGLSMSMSNIRFASSTRLSRAASASWYSTSPSRHCRTDDEEGDFPAAGIEIRQASSARQPSIQNIGHDDELVRSASTA